MSKASPNRIMDSLVTTRKNVTPRPGWVRRLRASWHHCRYALTVFVRAWRLHGLRVALSGRYYVTGSDASPGSIETRLHPMQLAAAKQLYAGREDRYNGIPSGLATRTTSDHEAAKAYEEWFGDAPFAGAYDYYPEENSDVDVPPPRSGRSLASTLPTLENPGGHTREGSSRRFTP